MNTRVKAKDLIHYDANDLRAIESTGQLHTDAGESIYFARQLEYIKGQAYDVIRAPLSGMLLMPVSTEVPEGAETITYYQYDQVGAAKIIASYADDLPRADVSARPFSSPVRGVGISYGYNMQEIRGAQHAGRNLDASKMQAAKQGHEDTINKLIWNGDSISGIPGFLNNVNMPVYVAPADGAINGGTASKRFIHKTPAQILRDLNGMVQNVRSVTKDHHKVNELWLPTEAFTHISVTPRSDTSDTTILQFFIANQPEDRPIRVRSVLELDGAGAGGASVGVALENSRTNYEIEVPMVFRQHAPQLRGLEFVVPCESRFGGVIIRFPMAFVKVEGI